MPASMRNKNLKMLMIATAIAIFIKVLLHAENGLTPQGVSFLAIFVATMFLWMFCDSVWPSFLSLTAFGVFRVLSVTDIFTASFGHNFVAMLIGSLILAEALNETGATEYIARWCLTRKAINGRPFVFLLFETLAIYIISIMTSAFLVAIIFPPIIIKMLRSMGIDKDDNMTRASMFAIMWFSVGGELMFPFGKSMPLLIVNYINTFGYTFGLTQYMLLSIPFFVVYTIAGFLIIRLLVNPKSEKFNEYDPAEIQEQMKKHPLGKKAKWCIGAMILMMLMIILPVCDFIPEIAAYFASYQSTIAFFIPISLMCVIEVDGEPLLDLRKVGAKINWSIVLFFATMFFYVTYIGDERFGIIKWLADVIMPITNYISPSLLLVFVAFITAIMTNFISNMVSLALNVSLFVPVFQTMYDSGMTDIKPFVVLFIIGIAANTAYATPGAGIVAGILYPSGVIDPKQSLLPNTVMLLVSTALLLIVTPVFGGMI